MNCADKIYGLYEHLRGSRSKILLVASLCQVQAKGFTARRVLGEVVLPLHANTMGITFGGQVRESIRLLVEAAYCLSHHCFKNKQNGSLHDSC